MKWIKRLFVLVLVLALGGATFLGTSYYLSKRKPSWYKPVAMNSREMQEAANRAVNKGIVIHNMADEAASRETAAEYARVHGSTLPASKPAVDPITVSFTQEELTAFIIRWSTLHSEKVEKYVTDPQFVMQDGQIVFGANITELGQFGSLHLDPSIDEKGMLHLELVSIHAGSLPVPEAMVQKHLAKVQAMLREWLPAWQQSATLSASGANNDAVKAAMTELLLNTLRHEPSPALLFMPIDQHNTVPVKLTRVTVGAGTLTLTVEPLTARDRQNALQTIREPYGTPTASN